MPSTVFLPLLFHFYSLHVNFSGSFHKGPEDGSNYEIYRYFSISGVVIGLFSVLTGAFYITSIFFAYSLICD